MRPEMSDESPATCSLAPEPLGERVAWISEISAQGLLSRESDGDLHRLRFRSEPGLRQQLEELVAAESKCCSRLSLSLEEDGAELVLSISAPVEAQPLARALAESF
jgi:hypothetical protein